MSGNDYPPSASFPATAIGRSPGLPSQASSDSLSHPLLSSSPQVGPLSSITSGQHARHPSDQAIDPLAHPKYVPYTPRHRAPIGSPTTSTSAQQAPIVSVTPPQIAHGGATGKLQVQNLKAAARSLGLNSGSIGWAMLERFVGETDIGSWHEPWSLVTSGKASLILPAEPLSGSLDLSLEFIQDHVVFCNGPSTSKSPIIALSGLRGTLESDRITFVSTVPTSSHLFAGLLNPSTRSSTLLTAPPLPHPLTPNLTSPYPSFAILRHSGSLPCPPRHLVSSIPPPLPARPGIRAGSAASTTAASSVSRLNPFASLFGRPSAVSSSTSLPAPLPGPMAARSPSPPSSISSINSQEPAVRSEHVDVQAFIIDHCIKRKRVCKDIQTSAKFQIKDVIGTAGAALPVWTITRVIEFCNMLYEVYFDKNHANDGYSNDGPNSTSSRILQPTPVKEWRPDLSTPSSTSDSFQAFLVALEVDVTSFYSTHNPSTVNKKPSTEDSKLTSTTVEKEAMVREREMKINKAMDAVERVICSLFYDRLFAPDGSDDKSHDEALSNRVAALNMLDLTLEHLGVEVEGDGAQGVDEVARAVGRELQRLEDPLCRSPGEKAAILVAAHNTVVDGLARLPRVVLKPEADTVIDANKTPMATNFDRQVSPETVEKEQEQEQLGDPRNPIPTDPIITTTPAHRTPSSEAEPSEKHTASTTPETVIPVEKDLEAANSSIPKEIQKSTTPPSGSAATKTPVSSDILLPIMIYSVVKCNPTQLVSHILYIQRFRRHAAAGGEEGFCLINTMAVADFLENVDMDALGLTETDRVSIADLEPIPIPTDATIITPTTLESNLPSRLRGKVEQQVGDLAGSANKVITGVVDSSFSALRGLLGHDANVATAIPAQDVVVDEGTAVNPRQGFGLLRRASGFSIASVAASLPGSLGKDRRLRGASVSTTLAVTEEGGQQMIEVPSRPGSVRSRQEEGDGISDGEEDEDEDRSSDDDDDSQADDAPEQKSDVRSIRSFGSMISESKEEHKQRRSLSDRLANVSRTAGGTAARISEIQKASSPPSRRTSLFVPSPKVSPSPLPDLNSLPINLPKPKQRFMECEAEDLRLSEVSTLLKEYRLMVEALQSLSKQTAP